MQTKGEHTPGPWRVRTLERDGKLLGCFVSGPDVNGFGYGAEILGDDEYRDGMERRLADCHLIAAAPDMLEALVHIIGAAHEAPCFGPFDQIDNTGEPYQSADFESALAKGRAAIARAKVLPS